MKNKLIRLYDRLLYPYSVWVRSPRHTQDVLATIDRDAFKSLLAYKFQTLNLHYQKYLNIDYWMRLNVVRALYTGLHMRPKSSLLDIGSGFGYFPYAARFYNHDVIGIDMPGDTLFDKAVEFLELDVRHHMIMPKKKLPKFGRKFDLVTAFQVCFNGHKTDTLWGVEEWRFFLDDLYANHMNEGGQCYFEFNYEPAVKGWLSPEVKKFFEEEYNAKFKGLSRVTLSKKK